MIHISHDKEILFISQVIMQMHKPSLYLSLPFLKHQFCCLLQDFTSPVTRCDCSIILCMRMCACMRWCAGLFLDSHLCCLFDLRVKLMRWCISPFISLKTGHVSLYTTSVRQTPTEWHELKVILNLNFYIFNINVRYTSVHNMYMI